MKQDFKNLNFEDILNKRIVFLYGNFSEFIYSFCEYFSEFYINNLKFEKTIKRKTIPCNDFLKEELTQISLFSSEITLYNIENVLDNNYQELFNKIKEISTNNKDIFFLQAGDYRKSKQVTDCFTKDKNIISIPLFKNSYTYEAILKKTIAGITKVEIENIIKLIENSTEDFLSLIKKMLLLKDCDNSQELIRDYYVEKEHFFAQFEPIPLLRYLEAIYTRDSSLEKLSEELGKPQNVEFKNILGKSLFSEINIKRAKDITTSDILDILFLTR